MNYVAPCPADVGHRRDLEGRKLDQDRLEEFVGVEDGAASSHAGDRR